MGFVALLGVVVALIFVLELLNALYDSFVEGHLKATVRDPKRGPLQLLRAPFMLILAGSRSVGLIFHELAHAAVQALGGSRPRVVLCKNGGYAEPSPWASHPVAFMVAGYGNTLLGGLACLAPLLLGSAVLWLLVRFVAPLDAVDVGRHLDTWVAASAPAGLSALPAAIWGTIRLYVTEIFAAGAGRTAIILVGGLLLAGALTPSSTDFAVGKYHFVAYLLAGSCAQALYLFVPGAGGVLLGVGLVAFVGFHFIMARGRWAFLFGTFGLTCITLAILGFVGVLGADPALGLRVAAAALAMGLLLAVAFYLVFMVLLVALSLITFRLSPIGLMFVGAPRHLAQVFSVFHTCVDCNLHFHGDRCDSCGSTPAELAEREARKRTVSPLDAFEKASQQPPEASSGGFMKAFLEKAKRDAADN